MGWSFEVGTGKRGPRYHNIIFKGERIVYELAVTEAVAGACVRAWCRPPRVPPPGWILPPAGPCAVVATPGYTALAAPPQCVGSSGPALQLGSS